MLLKSTQRNISESYLCSGNKADIINKTMRFWTGDHHIAASNIFFCNPLFNKGFNNPLLHFPYLIGGGEDTWESFRQQGDKPCQS